jgi:Fe-S oxidoreductase
MPPKHSLPLLARRRDELSKCAYCPKLCRASCVVSESEPREAITPWGKMTSAFDVARGAPLTPERAELAWACSNCFRCREACDHQNPVSPTLNDVRADYVERGLAPVGVRALIERRPLIEAEHELRAEALAAEGASSPLAGQALLLGCRYIQQFPDESRAALRLVRALSGPVELLRGCCGAWQRALGAPASADAARERLQAELAQRRLLVLDPRCALELSAAAPTTLVELSARHAERFATPERERPVRYHDSCALGRGLGLYAEPRRLLSRVTGCAPRELETERSLSRCSGAGGGLPVAFPDIANAASQRLAAEHERLGGGRLITSCASSLSLLRRSGVDAVDLVAFIEAALDTAGP